MHPTYVAATPMDHDTGTKTNGSKERRRGQEFETLGVFFIFLLYFIYQMFIYTKLSVRNEKTTTTTPVLTPQTMVNPLYVQRRHR